MKRLRELFYQQAPYALQNLLISTYGIHLKRIRYGPAYVQSMRELECVDSLPSSEIQRLENERLDRFVREAVAHVPHYRSRYQRVLEIARPLTRDDIRTHFPILEKRYVKDHRLDFVSEVASNSGLTTVFTSGTTGSPMEITATKAAVARNFAFFSRFLSQHGLDQFAWSATFAGRLIVPRSQQGPPFWRCNYPMRTWLFSSYHIGRAQIPAYLEQLEKIRPTYIDSYPSSIYTIARYIVREKVRHSLRPAAIVTSSEVLTVQQRETIEEAFHCPVYDQYGSAEMVVFASQCALGSYHLHPLYGLTEIVDRDGNPCRPGEVGDLIVTGLINDAMPLIRYRIGDGAAFSAQRCPCGSTHPALPEILGRSDDYIVTPEGNYVGRLDPLFKGLKGLVESQVVQDSLEHLEVLVVPDKEFDESTREYLIRNLRERVGERIRIEVRVVECIPRGAGGKFRAVISKVRGSSAQ